MDIDLDPTERAQTYQELSERLNHRHPKKYKAVVVLEKKMRETSKLLDDEEERAKRMQYLQEVFKDEISQQIKNERIANGQDTRQLKSQDKVLRELPDNPRWRDKFEEVVDIFPNISIQDAQGIIAFELGERLRDMACSLFREYGKLPHIFAMYKSDQYAIQAILQKAKEDGTLKKVETLTSDELHGLYQFFEVEDHNIPDRQVWNPKESALKKIKQHVKIREHNIAV